MNRSAVVHARIEPQTKRAAESVSHELGLEPSDAIRLFYRQICLRKGLPFALHIPNRLTRKTLDKSARGEDVTCFDSLEEMFASWRKARLA